jgi:hypothetical protein
VFKEYVSRLSKVHKYQLGQYKKYADLEAREFMEAQFNQTKACLKQEIISMMNQVDNLNE